MLHEGHEEGTKIHEGIILCFVVLRAIFVVLRATPPGKGNPFSPEVFHNRHLLLRQPVKLVNHPIDLFVGVIVVGIKSSQTSIENKPIVL